jgi:hypothetical protein
VLVTVLFIENKKKRPKDNMEIRKNKGKKTEVTRLGSCPAEHKIIRIMSIRNGPFNATAGGCTRGPSFTGLSMRIKCTPVDRANQHYTNSLGVVFH